MNLVIQRIEEALNIQENAGSFIEIVIEDLGFSYGKPVAAVTIYKCLVNWNYFQAERTSLFDQLIQFFDPENDDQHNNDKMAYWLSQASTLLFLIQQSLNLHGASSVPKPPPPTSPSGKIKMQLTASLEKIYGILLDNLKEELRLLLGLCIQPMLKSKKVRRSQQSVNVSQVNHWRGIVDRLDTLSNTLKENFVPPILVQKIFTQLFSFINAQLLNRHENAM
ncbi:hypothetical protein L2E82_29894 [Cichorium intybus]|uniref:Uncharacterized protein n=1 Tax=Cichorium intybus TaxID=13427 RepID=A0ACB9CZ99_CICIN|nr:hypothetical protein L2E82_29894 [Cichorium intybus]